MVELSKQKLKYMKILPSNSTLLVIDVQEKLLPKIYENQDVMKNVIWAIDLAKIIGIPMLLTEHCPEKIGTTPAIIREKFEENDIVTKTYFSAVREGNLLEHIQKERKQIIVRRNRSSYLCTTISFGFSGIRV